MAVHKNKKKTMIGKNARYLSNKSRKKMSSGNSKKKKKGMRGNHRAGF